MDYLKKFIFLVLEAESPGSVSALSSFCDNSFPGWPSHMIEREGERDRVNVLV